MPKENTGAGALAGSAKTQFELSELREKINTLSPEQAAQRSALVATATELEKRWRKEVLSEREGEAEQRAQRENDPRWRELVGEVRCGTYLQRAIEERAVDGAEAELSKELGIGDTGRMPWEALLDPGEEQRMARLRDRGAIEERADVATTIADSVVHRPRMEVLERVFARTDAAFCGVMMPSVPRGHPNYPVMTAGTAGSMEAPGGAVSAAAATFTAQTITPTRGTARYLLRVEDIAVFQDLESILRMDLRTVLGRLYDSQVVAGDGTTNNLSGFISHMDSTGVSNPSAVSNLAAFDTAFADGIDELYAYSTGSVRMLIGDATYKYLRTKRHDETANTWMDLVMRAGIGGMRLTQHVPEASSDIEKAYRFIPEAVRAYGPVWQGIEMIRDPYTGAAKGEIALTILMLFGFDVVRTASMKEVRFKLA